MDALFSLPVISLVLIPAMSSYATSLNIIFFYMTWSTLVLSHSPIRVELAGTITVRLLFFILPSLLFFLFDILTPSAAVIVKAQGEAGLPSGKKRGMIRARELKVAGWSLFNVLLGLILQSGIEYLLVKLLGIRSAVKVSMKLPMPWEIGQGLVFGLLIREGLTYTIHRYVLHNKKSILTRSLTEWHESWYHSLRTPFPLTAHYDHPITWIIGRFIPSFLPAMLLRMHMITYIIFLSTLSVEETFVYSGYTVMPTSFFLGGIARRVDEHLLKKGEGNFGPWGIFDWIFSTTVGESTIEDDLEAEFDSDEFQEKVLQALESSKQKIREGTLRRKTRGRKRSSIVEEHFNR
ncbi:uncharacterized protein N7483_003688 [Penicillium malachiteum]|uniref:uncharacterized protein n=1 Tax=Penicillium malachiteum TaxID=1324776 RepID=UPI002548B977|nr:uncharacterized protein N7483_003688 [Penicillium malachiteum]KAJ5729180.1 hypothetical protein N7483_003688 [Penicillium malachiteum]